MARYRGARQLIYFNGAFVPEAEAKVHFLIEVPRRRS